MRRSIDDSAAVHPDEDSLSVSWAVAAADDYDDGNGRVVLTVEELGRAGIGLVAHLDATGARRLRVALRDALRELGEEPD